MHTNRAQASGRKLKFLLFFVPALALGWWTWGPYPEHEDLTSKAVDIALQRWPEMTEELNAYRDQIIQGSHDEDFGEDTLYGASTDYSGYNPTVPDAWWPTAQLHLNALQWTHALQNPYSWENALARYGGSPSDAWLAVGHVIHNLEDLFVPAHSFIAPHGSGTSGLVDNHSWPLYFDNFEQYDEVTENELGRADPNRIPEAYPTPDTLMIQASLYVTGDHESLGYYPTTYFAPPDFAGDWGKYRPYPYNGYPSGEDMIDNDIANTWSQFIVPRCIESNAALIRLFWELTHTAIAETPVTAGRPAFSVAPNPFSSRVTFRIASSARCKPLSALVIRDASGRLVREMRLTGGEQSVVWNGADNQERALPAGVYYCQSAGTQGSEIRPIVKLR